MTVSALENEFNLGSLDAGIILAELYIRRESRRGIEILEEIHTFDSRARRLLAFCHLYGVLVPKSVSKSRELLINM